VIERNMFYYFNCGIYFMLINDWNTYTKCFALMITPSICDDGVILISQSHVRLVDRFIINASSRHGTRENVCERQSAFCMPGALDQLGI